MVRSPSYEDVRRPDSDRRAVVVGTATTMTFIALAWASPSFLPLDAIRMAYFEATGTWVSGNPLRPLRLAGGVPGGALAAVLTEGRLIDSVRNAMKAAIYAPIGLYLAVVGYFLARSVLLGEVFPVIQVLVTPAVLGLFVGLASVLGGFVGGLLGHGLRVLAGDIRSRDAGSG